MLRHGPTTGTVHDTAVAIFRSMRYLTEYAHPVSKLCETPPKLVITAEVAPPAVHT